MSQPIKIVRQPCGSEIFLFACIAVKSLGSLIGGQLISSKVGLNTPQLFRYTAIITSTLGLAYFGLYYMFAKKAELALIDKLDKQYPGERTQIGTTTTTKNKTKTPSQHEAKNNNTFLKEICINDSMVTDRTSL